MMMFNFTGSEKAAAALTPLMAPFTVILIALLAAVGLGEMPNAEVLAQAIAFTIITIASARLVWQVPNSTPEQIVEAKKVEVTAAKAEAHAEKEIAKIEEQTTPA